MNLDQLTFLANDLGRPLRFGRHFHRVIRASLRHARFECAQDEAVISQRVAGHPTGRTGVVAYVECPDLEARVVGRLAAGFGFTTHPTDEPWLRREACRVDPSGHGTGSFGIGHPRKHSPGRLADERDPLVMSILRDPPSA